MNNPKIGILGVGAIGSVIVSYLNDDVVCFNRTHKDTINIKRFNKEINIPIDCKTTVNRHTLDWLIVCLKEHQYDNAKNWFNALIFENTKVVVIRNGIDLKEPLLPYTSSEKILECIIDCPTQLENDNFYHQLSKPKLTIPKTKFSVNFKELFNFNDVEINIASNFKTESWMKIGESSALGSILCLSGKTCEIFKEIIVQQLYKNILFEAISVAKKDRAIIDDSFINNALQKVLQYPTSKGSSMLTDRLQGKPIEIGAKNGVISNFGKKHGIKTPLNDKICELLKDINSTSENLLKFL